MKNETLNLKSIPPDKVVEIKIGGMFYQRLNKLLIDFCDMKDQKELLTSMYLIKNEQIPEDDAYTFNLDTLMVLLAAVEKAFEEAGHTTASTVNIELPDDFNINKITKM